MATRIGGLPLDEHPLLRELELLSLVGSEGKCPFAFTSVVILALSPFTIPLELVYVASAML